MKLMRFLRLFAVLPVLFAMLFAPVSASQWFVDVSIGDDTYDGTNPAVLGSNIGPFQSINWAIVMAVPGDSIYVAEGYYYGNILIDKAISIFGNNASIPGDGTRNAETIILPDQEDLSRGPNPLNAVIYINSPSVYIGGIRIDGDNTNITSGNDIRGRDVDISYGISNGGIFNNIQIVNNVFENLNVSGITFRGNVNSSNSNCQIKQNMFNNFGNNSLAIQCEGFYSDILSNLIIDASIGISFNDYKTSNGRSWQVNGNSVYANIIGFIIENCFENASSLFVENNLFSTPSGVISDFGVWMNNNRDNFTVRFTNNNLSNSGQAYELSGNNIPPILFDRDSIENCDDGIRVSNFDDNGKTDTILLNKCQFQTCATSGVELFNDSNRIDLIINNSIFKNSMNGVTLKGNCNVELNNTAFDNISNYYLQLDYGISGITSAIDIDATSCTFNGLTGVLSTDSTNFITEDKIRHYLDDNVFAFVTFKPKTIYITANDGNTQVSPAFAKTFDDWHVFMDTAATLEDVNVTKQLHFYTRGAVSIGSFTMNAPGKNLFMHGPIGLTNTLALNSGILNSTDGTVTVGEPLGFPPILDVSGGNAASYVEGPLGIVTETKAFDTTYYPVGKTGDFRPLFVATESSFNGAIGTIEVELNQGPAPFQNPAPDLTHTSLIHHWRTNNVDGIALDQIGFGGTYGTFMIDDEVSDPPNLRLAVADNGDWKNMGGVGTSSGNGIIFSTNSNMAMAYVTLANAGRGGNGLGKAGPIAAFEVLQSCFPDSVQFNDISATTGDTIVSWQWDFGDTTALDTVQNPKHQYLTPGPYDVQMIIVSSTGESDTVVRTISVEAPPTAGFDKMVPCFPSPVVLTDTSVSTSPTDPIISWSWTVDSTSYSSSQVIHSFDTSGTYTVGLRVTSLNGCTDTVTQTIFQGDTVQMSISPAGPYSICDGDTTALTATPGLNSYLWSTGDTSMSIIVTQAGTYSVTGFNGNACFANDTATVVILVSPVADAGPDQQIEFGESTMLSGSGGGGYEWSPATGLSDKDIENPTAKPTSTTTYILRVFNSFGCEDFDTMVLTVEPFEIVDLPNLITPNGDGKNDAWDLSILPGYDSAKVSVVNRWGKEVFVSFNYKNDWEGTYNDNPLPDGTYMFIIENQSTFGVIKGAILILR
jgi:gliding motility-associated-like protein